MECYAKLDITLTLMILKTYIMQSFHLISHMVARYGDNINTFNQKVFKLQNRAIIIISFSDFDATTRISKFSSSKIKLFYKTAYLYMTLSINSHQFVFIAILNKYKKCKSWSFTVYIYIQSNLDKKATLGN